METERKNARGSLLSEIILGGQDGLVNVLGIVLGVAVATNNVLMVIVAGIVATFAESISMAAVAYSSSRAAQDHYKRELEQEKWEIENVPEIEREEIRLIYLRRGFSGKELDKIVRNVTASKEVWLSVMMTEELGLAPVPENQPIKAAAIVGVSAIVGSLIPLAPFAFFGVVEAIAASLVISTITLFAVGAYKAKVTVGDWKKSGLEMAGVGMLAAIAGYLIGKIAGSALGLGGAL